MKKSEIPEVERKRQNSRNHYARYRDYERQRSRKNHLRKKYKITEEDYKSMLAAQSNCCAICGKDQSTSTKNMHVDHDHTTGKIRELLCNNCNTLLGFAAEDRDILLKAIEYLDFHSSGRLDLELFLYREGEHDIIFVPK